jgi:hypothetical protein
VPPSRHYQHAYLTSESIKLPDVSAELAQSPITGMSTDPTSCLAGSSALGIQFPGADDGGGDGDDEWV